MLFSVDQGRVFSDIFYGSSQAFSHFTFERSGHQLIIVDIQGVGDLYTDPQIHTENGTDFGDGNLGKINDPVSHANGCLFSFPSWVATTLSEQARSRGVLQTAGEVVL